MGKRGIWIAFAFVFVFCTGAILSVDTALDIENSPPYLIELIPNQSWDEGNLLNAFDLDDYFASPVALILNYSSSEVSNVNVFINSSNEVSFYPDEELSAIRQVVFYASDGELNATSNTVYLFISMDDEPPKWIFADKDKGIVYQNDYVQFYTNWTDDFGLENYTFFIDQGSGYSEYPGELSGLADQSLNSVQISAASGQEVSWYFCAMDTSSNSNCTEEKIFVVSQKYFPPPSGSPPPSTDDDDDDTKSVTQKVANVIKKEVSDFKVSVSSFLVSVKQGSAQTKILEITNVGNTELNFNLSISGLDGFAILSDNLLSLSPGKTGKVTIDFFSDRETPPGNYFGEVLVKSASDISIPVVFEVNPLESDVAVSVLVTDEYKFVRPGNPVYANVTLNNLKDPIEEGVDLHLSLLDFYGKVYDSYDEVVNVNSVSTLTKNFSIPEDMPLGSYLFSARVTYEDKVLSVASDDFEVGVRFRFLAFIKSTSVFLLVTFLSLFSILFILRYRSLEKRRDVLNFYVQSLELKKLMAMNKFDEAVNLFTRMKAQHGEPVTKEMLEDKEQLKEQMKILAQKFDLEGEAPIAAGAGKAASAPKNNAKGKTGAEGTKEVSGKKTESAANANEKTEDKNKKEGKANE